jgi:hypothetical protein
MAAMPFLNLKLMAAAVLLAAGAGTAVGQVRSPLLRVDRATEAVARSQERASQAADAALRAQERVASAQERTVGAQDRTSRVQDAAANVLDRAGVAQDALDEVAGAGSKAALRGRDRAREVLEGVTGPAVQLTQDQLRRHQALVDAAPDRLEMTDLGPSVRGEVIAIDPDSATTAIVERLGYKVVSEEVIEGLGLRTVVLAIPNDMTVSGALAQLSDAAPAAEFAADHIYLPSAAAPLPMLSSAALARGGTIKGRTIGLIDGGVAEHPAVDAAIEQKGFAAGAPAPNAHATAVASLITGGGAVKAAAPGTPLVVADVFGTDPAGGSSLAIARALGWLIGRKTPVVVISLIGPPNPLVREAVSRARSAGVFVVAPVGNDGPAAPPAYPASYPGVIAVTGVDGRNRALIEAGRALHLDYAAPAADIRAAVLSDRVASVRGTSFAAPLVAGRLFLALRDGGNAIARLDREAVDLGAKGPDPVFGKGLLCARCRPSITKN